jgi:predicted RNase H-like HicB family nuclease
MLANYLREAMRKAHYQMLEDDGTFYAEIPGFQGVLSNAASPEECRTRLEQVLEEWVLLRVSRDLPLPGKLSSRRPC